MHALVGENGAGKSTLMKILAGVQRESDGELEVGGSRVSFASVAEAQAHGIAMVYQELALAPDLSIAENVFLGRLGPWVDHRALAARAAPWLEQVELDIDPRAAVRTLAVGEQQLVEIAKALAREGRILVLDEPTAALSATETERLFGIVRKLRERGVSVVYISHRLEEVFAIADRVTVLRDGAQVITRRVADITPDDVVRAMVGREVRRFERPSSARDTVLAEFAFGARAIARSNLTLRAGEIVGLAGVVGSGRNRILSLLFGLDGEATWNGEPVRSPRDAIRRGLVLIPEDRKAQGLVLELSVRENLSLAILSRLVRAGLLRHAAERAEANRWIDRLGVRPPEPDKRAGTLSGGNQQKVVVGKALATEPRILLMDEPTRGVDVGARHDIYTVIDELARSGLGLVIASSDTEELLGLCDRILVFRGGEVAVELTAPIRYEEVVGHVTGARQVA